MPVPILLGVILIALPPGLILLLLGSFTRTGGTCRACRYSGTGLKAGAKCPECGANDWELRTIPRSRRQVIVGGALVGLCVAAILELVRVLNWIA